MTLTRRRLAWVAVLALAALILAALSRRAAETVTLPAAAPPVAAPPVAAPSATPRPKAPPTQPARVASSSPAAPCASLPAGALRPLPDLGVNGGSMAAAAQTMEGTALGQSGDVGCPSGIVAAPDLSAVGFRVDSRGAPASVPSMSIVGAPSVTPAVVDAVLAREGSPLAGQSATILAEGRRAGIDPVFLLAVVARVDAPNPLPDAAHNVGHVLAAAGQPAANGFRVYPSWRAGIAGWYGLMRTLYVDRWGLRTLDAIWPVYAPGPREQVEAQLGALEAMVTAWRAQSAASTPTTPTTPTAQVLSSRPGTAR